jgi:CRP/FNR family transcriptional regulator, cyclic AMP receptor protein
VQTMQQSLAAQPFFKGLDPEALDLIAGCATNIRVEAGQYVATEGETADRFYVLRHGRVALELHEPGAGPQLLDMVESGEALGWSWLVPPYRWFLDARAVEPTSLLSIDGHCLRGKCDADPALGYALMQRVTRVMYQRLQSARVRLLDVYGSPRADAH